MDPLTALGVACNIMQVISFSQEVISVARRVYDQGVVDEDMLDKASHLKMLTSSVDTTLQNSNQPLSASDRELIKIAERCRAASEELQKTMVDLGSASAKGNLARSAKTSIKAIWENKRIKKLEKSMIQWQQTLDSGLLIRLCSKSEAQALQSSGSFEQLDNSLKKVIHELSRGNYNLTNMIAAESAGIKSHVTLEVSRATAETKVFITTQAKETQDNLSKQLNNFHITAAMEAKRDKLLRSLKYKELFDRQNMIPRSHVETFQWIFSEKFSAWANFVEWLRSAEKLYWISGKPGSGKSTLMKFIANDKQTVEYLKPDTFILSHYLWSVGTPMQRSIKGVLLALLYQILLDERLLVTSRVLDSAAFERKDSDSDWSLHELRSCFGTILSQCASSRPVCIFLDGLDEISHSEGPSDIIDLVDELSVIPGVKLCVSSRPEPAFVTRYSSTPRLRLQDLTRADMKKVCVGLLRKYKDNLPEKGIIPGTKDTTMDELVRQLLDKAEGVFLWVHLALKSIGRGVSNSDSWKDILERLKGLPRDLDELYSSMWKRANIDQGIYEHSASLYLNLILESRGMSWSLFLHNDMSALELIFATEDSIQRSILCNQDSLTGEDLLLQCRPIMRKIEIRCAGLVEFNSLSSGPDYIPASAKWDHLVPLTLKKVDFIHRTAVDFLTGTEEGKKILHMDGLTLESRRMKLLRMALAIRTLWPISHVPPEGLYDDRVREILYLAIIWIPETSKSSIQEVHEHCQRIWAKACRLYTLRVPGVQPPDFLGRLASIGCYSAVRERIATLEAVTGKSTTQAYDNHLLHAAYYALSVTVSPEVISGGLELVRWLDGKGADPLATFFDFEGMASSLPRTSFVTSPFKRLLNWTLNELIREQGQAWNRPRPPTITPAIDTLLRVLKGHNINSCLNKKSKLELDWHNCESGLVGCEFDTEIRDGHDLGRPRMCYLEVNTAFLLQFFNDLLILGTPEPQKPDDSSLEALGEITKSYSTQFKPSARLVCFNETAHWRSCVRPLPQCFLPEESLRSLIIASFRSCNDSSRMKQLRSEMVDMVLKAVGDGETIEIRNEEDFVEQFKDIMFKGWPPPPELGLEPFPPPMFEE